MNSAITWNGLITAVIVVLMILIFGPVLLGIFLGAIQCVIVFVRDEVLRSKWEKRSDQMKLETERAIAKMMES